jgi:hypothetical protein
MLKLLFSSWGAEWGTAALVFAVSAAVGRFAAEGMNTLQWCGAITAVLASVTAAVAVRVWKPEAAEVRVED